MRATRPAAVAGSFYPEDPQALIDMIGCFFSQSPIYNRPLPKAIICPHAGYIYSGQIAADTYACFKQTTATIDKVILIGPSHHHRFTGVAVPKASTFSTPLGKVHIDDAAMRIALSMKEVKISEMIHLHEHSLEVQLPFIQSIFPQASILPVLVGHCSPGLLVQLMASLIWEDNVLLVVSSDMSHELDYQSALKRDEFTIKGILESRLDLIVPSAACGATAIKALIHLAKNHPLHPSLVRACNSGDTAGDKRRVVGYAGIHYHQFMGH